MKMFIFTDRTQFTFITPSPSARTLYAIFMKILLTFILINFAVNQHFGQSENRFAKEVFRMSYRETIYPKYTGKIETVGNVLKFGDKVIKFEDNKFSAVFEKGVFNPDVIFGKETTKYLKSKVDSLSPNQKMFFNLTRNDSLYICCVDELTELNPNLKTKRFKFWLFRIGIMNPTEYYLEFYNYEATKETSVDELFENAIMTFFYAGTIII
jgi:hypothetical protein